MHEFTLNLLQIMGQGFEMDSAVETFLKCHWNQQASFNRLVGKTVNLSAEPDRIDKNQFDNNQ